MFRLSLVIPIIAILMAFCEGSSAHAAAAEEQLIEAMKVALGKNFSTDCWRGVTIFFWENEKARANTNRLAL